MYLCMRTLMAFEICVIVIAFVFSTGCRLNQIISKKNSESTDDKGDSLPAWVPSKSIIKTEPETSQIPLTGTITVKYCLKDQMGKRFNNPDLNLIFSLNGGSSSGSFSPVTYNSSENCYQSDFTAESIGTPVEIIPQMDSTPIESIQEKYIEVMPPRLSFTGNSTPSTNLNDRIFNELSGPRSIEGDCDPLLGDVKINGGLNALTMTTCQPDGTFSININVDSTTSPYFKVTPFPDPLIMIKQGSLKPQQTRLYRVHSSWTNVFISNANELQTMTTSGSFQAKNYFLTSDIDLSAVSATNNFTPIGISAVDYWSGRLFGEGHTINNLHIDGGIGNNIGILGYVDNNSYITDIKIENGTVNGGANVALLVGQLRLSYAHRISLTGNVSGTVFVGLLAGRSWDGDIREAVVSGTITSDSDAGGIAGVLWGGDIINSWSDVALTTSASRAGGLTGTAYQAFDMVIENSFSMGTISGNYLVGGAVGEIQEFGSPFALNYFRNSFSLADVNATIISGSGNDISGPVIGMAGTYSNPNYTPDPDNIISGLHYLSTVDCINCTEPNTHATGESLENILSWSQTVWDYEWIWQIHGSGTRPDLINNPRP